MVAARPNAVSRTLDHDGLNRDTGQAGANLVKRGPTLIRGQNRKSGKKKFWRRAAGSTEEPCGQEGRRAKERRILRQQASKTSGRQDGRTIGSQDDRTIG